MSNKRIEDKLKELVEAEKSASHKMDIASMYLARAYGTQPFSSYAFDPLPENHIKSIEELRADLREKTSDFQAAKKNLVSFREKIRLISIKNFKEPF